MFFDPLQHVFTGGLCMGNGIVKFCTRLYTDLDSRILCVAFSIDVKKAFEYVFNGILLSN